MRPGSKGITAFIIERDFAWKTDIFIQRLMQAAFDYAIEYIQDGKQFGQPVGTFQLMQAKT